MAQMLSGMQMKAETLQHVDEAKPAWFMRFAVFAVALIIFQANTGDLLFRDPDLLWHITVGNGILETRAFPWVDEFSHTFRNHPWVAKEWLSQVVFAVVNNVAGLRGLAVLISISVALTITLLFGVLVQHLRLVPALIGALFAYSLAASYFFARPHMLSFPLIVWWFAGLVRTVEAGRAPKPFLLAIMVLWANVHGSFTFGIMCVGPFAIEAVMAARPVDRVTIARNWGLFFLGAVLASLVTPYGYHTLGAAYQLLGGNNEALQFIIEWQPFNFARDRYIGLLILLALFASLLSGVKLPFIRCVLVVGLLYQALIHFRFVALAAIIVPILVAGPLAKQFTYLGKVTHDPPLASFLRLARKPLLRFAGVTMLIFGVVASALLPVRALPPIIAPVAAVDYLAPRLQDRKIYNDMLFGGYLILRGIPTFIDGRNDQLFGGGFLGGLYRTIDGPARDFRALLDRNEIQFALVRPKSREAYALDDGLEWRLAYSDDNAIVYERIR